jgi:hypothetical protein
MNIPGLSTEASVYKPVGQYWAVAAGSSFGSQVFPMTQCSSQCCSYCDDCECLREKYNRLSVAPAGKSARAIPTACNVVCAFIAADIRRSAASEAGRLTQGL